VVGNRVEAVIRTAKGMAEVVTRTAVTSRTDKVVEAIASKSNRKKNGRRKSSRTLISK
jgi:hypothetical protein